MMNMQVRNAIYFLVLFGVSPLTMAWDSPKQAVQKYLDFDAKGGRLSGWEFGKYLDAPANYEEPGWDTITLIKSYEIGVLKCQPNSCDVQVTYTLLPTNTLEDQQLESHPQGGQKQLDIQVVKVGKQWLLKPFDAGNPHMPHVARQVLTVSGK